MNKEKVTSFKKNNHKATLILWHKYYTGGYEKYEVEVLYNDAPTYKVLETKDREEAYRMYAACHEDYKTLYK